MITFKEFFNIKSHSLVLEGGSYGHMANLYEDWNRTFDEFINICRNSLRGYIDQVKEKTDGQALTIGYRKGKVLFARNKGEYMHFGENAMKGWKDVEQRFHDHPNGNVRDAFIYAAKDLDNAIQSLDKEDKKNFFCSVGDDGNIIEGSKWIHLEVIWPPSENVIPYNHKLLVLHNFREYDYDGNVIGGDFNEYASQIEKRLEKTNNKVQEKFTITSMQMLKLPKQENLGKATEQIIQPIYDIMHKYGLRDSNTLGDYWVAYMRDIVDTEMQRIGYVNTVVADQLAYRWAFKSTPQQRKPHDYNTRGGGSITNIKKQIVNKGFKLFVTEMERQSKELYDQMIQPVKDTCLLVGVEVIKKVTKLLTLNPDEAVRKIRNSIEEAILKINASGDEQLIDKLKTQLSQIEKAGGLEAIVPTEGLAFTYQPPGNPPPPQIVYKWTGVFGPVNQILGMNRFKR